ncbi:hypothetical protein KY285_010807 [Solanum tuberosum]|nr:hypothetical protein KY289_011380 [Solanum tuberosum]KAH0735100.1 hypothetical protein KY285_010807 [Solanum tuberosum]
MQERVVVPRGFITGGGGSSTAIHLEVEIIQVIAHRVIQVDQCNIPFMFRVQMVLVDLGLFRTIRIRIVGPQVRKIMKILLVTQQDSGAIGCFVCEEFGHKAKDFPRHVSSTI